MSDYYMDTNSRIIRLQTLKQAELRLTETPYEEFSQEQIDFYIQCNRYEQRQLVEQLKEIWDIEDETQQYAQISTGC
jgi:hypothetical protein